MRTLFPAVIAANLALTCNLSGEPVTVVNAGFEDTTGQTPFNEFTFGLPVGWDLYDPNDIVPSTGVFTGTLEPNGIEFFGTGAPQADLVAILFNSRREGEGEYGFVQTLTENLQANTDYALSVQVGNIGSGVATDGTFFNLDEFPGYRVDLLAGESVIASDLNSLTIPESEFALSTVEFSTGHAHPLLGQPLGIRLVNLNQIPAGFTQETSPDLEVDFDGVQLIATTSIPEPGSGPLALVALGVWLLRRRRD